MKVTNGDVKHEIGKLLMPSARLAMWKKYVNKNGGTIPARATEHFGHHSGKFHVDLKKKKKEKEKAAAAAAALVEKERRRDAKNHALASEREARNAGTWGKVIKQEPGSVGDGVAGAGAGAAAGYVLTKIADGLKPEEAPIRVSTLAEVCTIVNCGTVTPLPPSTPLLATTIDRGSAQLVAASPPPHLPLSRSLLPTDG
jgi:hypothetical protein